MKKTLLSIVILFFAGWIAAYVAFAGYGLIFGKPVPQQAMDAYNRGDYAAALPLFKKWGEMPEVRKNPQQQQAVLAYIVDIENRMKPSSAVAGTSVTATGPVDQAQLMQQAMAFALNRNQNAGDIPTGADRVPHKRIAPGETRELVIKQLGNFEFDPAKDEDVPPDVKALEGGRLRLIGFMIPLTQANEITRFALVPSLVGCCFGQPPGEQHIITVTMDKDKATDYSLDELVVEGTLHINVQRQEGYTYSIFELTATSVKLKE